MTPHEILGIEVGASEKEIKSAYRKKAKECHPDAHPGDPDAVSRFHALNDAYEALTNPKPTRDAGFSGFNGFDFEEILRNSGFGFNHNRQPVNSTLQAMASITLEQAYHGIELSLTVMDEIVTIRLPAGVHDGQRYKVDGKGGREHPQFPAGDLILIVRVSRNDVWSRHGDDLVTAVPLDYLDVILGKEVEIPTLDGKKILVKVPPRQTRVRVQGKGMPIQNTDRNGDMYVMVEPKIPELDAKELARLKKVRRTSK